MSDATVIAAAVGILRAAIPSLVTVLDRLDSPPEITSDRMPAVIIADSDSTEDRIAGGPGGPRMPQYYLENHVYNAYAAPSGQAFRQLVESVRAAYRAQPQLGHQADVAGTSFVLLAGDGLRALQTRYSDWINNADGSVLMHAMVRVRIREVSA